MTIKLTDEMTDALIEHYGYLADDREQAEAGLRVVLAIVERDLPDVEALVRGAYARGQSDERALTQLLGPPDCPSRWHTLETDDMPDKCPICGATE
jgi:rubrerythrin